MIDGWIPTHSLITHTTCKRGGWAPFLLTSPLPCSVLPPHFWLAPLRQAGRQASPLHQSWRGTSIFAAMFFGRKLTFVLFHTLSPQANDYILSPLYSTRSCNQKAINVLLIWVNSNSVIMRAQKYHECHVLPSKIARVPTLFAHPSASTLKFA